MKVAVNLRLVLPGKMDGIGWFAYETTRRIVAQHPDDCFLLLFDRNPETMANTLAWGGLQTLLNAKNVDTMVLCPQARHPLLWWLFFEFSVPQALRHWKADMYLSPDGMMPTKTMLPTLSVIHDINFEHSADNIRRSHSMYMRHYFPLFARGATRVATVSEYSKSDIAATYGVPYDRIDVVYDGAHDRYRPHSEAECVAIRQSYTDGNPYIIFISTILRRKNLAGLLRAFDIVKANDSRGLKLLVVGSRVWWQDELKEAYATMRHRDDVMLLGRVEPAELAALLSASEALVYPSLFEGFGIPILEAMYAETAVVCSNTTSMPEVGGEAVEYVDPTSDEDIARGIFAVLDHIHRNELIARGRVQRQLYNWDRTASLLWESMQKTVAAQQKK